jgi:phospholipase/lecithinase/hemolysin
MRCRIGRAHIRLAVPQQGRWRQLLAVVAVVLSISLVPVMASAGLFQKVFVFGDSLSDTGNVFTVTGSVPSNPIPVSPPYFTGRFSNGPVWVEILAELLDLELRPFLAGGTNFAFGGAEIELDTEDVFERDIGVTIPSIRSQVQAFFAQHLFDDTDSEALYIIWGGANDLRDALVTATDPLTAVQPAVDGLIAAIEDLADAGAVYFLIPNLPNLGHTPESRGRGPDGVARATAVSVAFNNALATALDSLEAGRSITIIRLDTFARLEEVMANPAAFGFTNATEACLAGDPFVGGTPCTQPTAYVFWDLIHPTAAAHAILAEFAFAALPPLLGTRGDASPQDSIDISLPMQNLPVLQMRLGTGADTVHLTSATLNFTQQTGQATVVETIRAHLINDANANGQFDAGEAVLAIGEAHGAVTSLAWDISPPFDISPASTIHLLVTLDINSAADTAARGESPLASTRYAHLPPGWLAVFLPVTGLLGFIQRRCRARRGSLGVCIFILCCSLTLTSCDSVDSLDDAMQQDKGNSTAAFTFTVVLPAQGITGQGATSGPLTAPAAPITGATVRLLP